MHEQSKAKARRLTDPRYANRWLVGRGIDIGCGPNPLDKADWPKIQEVVPYDQDRGSGDAQFMSEIKDGEFDFAHSAHCLEHVRMPQTALTNWLRIIKPGGFLVVTIPEEYLYECGMWPSRFNGDHKFSFTMRGTPVMPKSINVAWMLYKTGADIEHLSLLTDKWDKTKFGQDQTLGPAECAIEFVLRKPSKDPF